VLIAGGADLVAVLEELRRERPVFHSEADFQQAFAWEVHRAMPQARVRIETRPAPRVRLDLLVESEDRRRRSAIELKYLTRSWSGEVGGERFELRSQGAQDIRAYDVIKDVGRVEHGMRVTPGCDGAVIVLSNDTSYWMPPGHDRETNAAAFRLYEGRQLDGVRAWGRTRGRARCVAGRCQSLWPGRTSCGGGIIRECQAWPGCSGCSSSRSPAHRGRSHDRPVVEALLTPPTPLPDAVASPAAGGMPPAAGLYAW
jgi:hypothetical protein